MKTKKAIIVKALLIIDVQNDFCPGGVWAVPEGNKVVPVLNKYVRLFSKRNLPIFATHEWHPRKTKHFKDFGGKWAIHCVLRSVLRTEGACFHQDLQLPKQTIILYKGMNSKGVSSSAFQAISFKGSSFSALLNFLGIKELYIGGLTTDYSVKATVLDAIKNGIRVRLLTDAIKGVNQKNSKKTIKKLLTRGVKKITFD